MPDARVHHQFCASDEVCQLLLHLASDQCIAITPDEHRRCGYTSEFGDVVVLIQPPRGYGDDQVAIYHDPDLPPSHHYLAAYRWLENEFGAHAVVHLGKHGSMEWLPGKTVALSADCATDAAIGSMPLVYPFLVNDPGEGAQAKRRAHATIVDHLIPPMARAEAYGDIARLEQLMDEHRARSRCRIDKVDRSESIVRCVVVDDDKRLRSARVRLERPESLDRSRVEGDHEIG